LDEQRLRVGLDLHEALDHAGRVKTGDEDIDSESHGASFLHCAAPTARHGTEGGAHDVPHLQLVTSNRLVARRARAYRSRDLSASDQRRSERTPWGIWFAWASMEVPAWERICARVKLTISDAMSVSRIRLSEAERFSTDTLMFLTV